MTKQELADALDLMEEKILSLEEARDSRACSIGAGDVVGVREADLVIKQREEGIKRLRAHIIKTFFPEE